MASARPQQFTAEQAMDFVMSYDSDLNQNKVAFCVLCFTVSVIVLCLCCVLSQFVHFHVYNKSA